MTTVLLIIHGLLAVALLGAITHQAAGVWWPARKPVGSFVGRFRSVPGASYTNAIIVLYLCTAALGGTTIYPEFRLGVRPALEQLGMWVALGAFDLKEHFTVIGLAMLPAYWYFWRQPLAEQHAGTRAALTAMLAFIVWWNFLVGHILNDMRGFGS